MCSSRPAVKENRCVGHACTGMPPARGVCCRPLCSSLLTSCMSQGRVQELCVCVCAKPQHNGAVCAAATMQPHAQLHLCVKLSSRKAQLLQQLPGCRHLTGPKNMLNASQPSSTMTAVCFFWLWCFTTEWHLMPLPRQQHMAQKQQQTRPSHPNHRASAAQHSL